MKKICIRCIYASILALSSIQAMAQEKFTPAESRQSNINSQEIFQDWLTLRMLEINNQQFLAQYNQSTVEMRDTQAEHIFLNKKAIKELTQLQLKSKEVKALVEQQITLHTLDLEGLKSANGHPNARLQKKIEKLSDSFEQNAEALSTQLRTQLYSSAATQPQFIRAWIEYQYISLANADRKNHPYSTAYLQRLSSIKTQDPQLSEFLRLKKKLITDILQSNPALSQNPFISITDPELYDQLEALELVLDKRMVDYFLHHTPVP